MAMQDFLKMFPKPESPKVYTGLFGNFPERVWSDRPNKCDHGVSYTKYEDAMNVHVGKLTLFDMFHGNCWYYAQYFKLMNPDWDIIQILRGNFWNNAVHTFCIKKADNTTFFADARGITDDPEVFFEDFSCSKEAYWQSQDLELEHKCFMDSYEKAYRYIFKDKKALTV